jgi:hypothetical protein
MENEEGSQEVIITVNMTSKILFDFMMVNSYSSLGGKIKWGVSFFFLLLLPFSIMYSELTVTFAIILILFLNLFVQPLTFLSSSKNQMLSNDMFKHPLKYTFTQEGLRLEAFKNSGMAKWEELVQVTETKDFLLIYASKLQAFIIPKCFVSEDADLDRIKEMVMSQEGQVKYKFKKK